MQILLQQITIAWLHALHASIPLIQIRKRTGSLQMLNNLDRRTLEVCLDQTNLNVIALPAPERSLKFPVPCFFIRFLNLGVVMIDDCSLIFARGSSMAQWLAVSNESLMSR